MTAHVSGEKIQAPLDKLKPNPHQRRKKFNITELADGIKANGFFGAILICKIPEEPGFYYIIAGERRVRACKSLGMTEISAELLTLTSEQIQRVCAIENLQREDLTPMEEAETYQDMLSRCSTVDRVAEETGKSRATIEKRLALLKLVPEVQQMVDDNKVNLQQAECLLEIDDPAKQLQVANVAVRGNMDVNRLKGFMQAQGVTKTGKKKENEGPDTQRRVTSKAVSGKVIELSDMLDGLDINSLKSEDLVTLISQFDVLSQTIAEKKVLMEKRVQGAGQSAAAA